MAKVNFTQYREKIVQQMGIRIMRLQEHVHELNDLGFKTQTSCIFKMHKMSENGRGMAWEYIHLTFPAIDIDINDLLRKNGSQLPPLPVFCEKHESPTFKPYPQTTPEIMISFNE